MAQLVERSLLVREIPGSSPGIPTNMMNRIARLKNNPKNLFWIQALLNVKAINVLSTLFYLSRGLTLEQVLITPVVWSMTSIIFETPSSYLADKWGRKKTIILGLCLYLV